MRRSALLLATTLVLGATRVMAADQSFEDFGQGADTRWDFVADKVMGGVSEGMAVIGPVDGRAAIALSGTVSTENNGGFIQARRLLPDGLPAGTGGLRLTVRGNGEQYYVFIRTREMTRPWYYYSAPFLTQADWSTVDLPLAGFTPSHQHLAPAPEPLDIISIGLVAYGRDHVADLAVAEISLY